jgi:hypothetical protein
MAIKEQVFGFNVKPENMAPFKCAACGEIMGYAYDVEYGEQQAFCLHPHCFELLRKSSPARPAP